MTAININEWALRHQITPQALQELQELLSKPAFPATEPRLPPGTSEARAQQEVRLEASKRGLRLWRNNVGAYSESHPPSPGTRWGLANESAAVNKAVKSSDLIGITPVTITPGHVGRILGVFTSIEMKRPGWVYKGNDHEAAQLAWLQLVVSLGGFAMFATDPAHLDGLK